MNTNALIAFGAFYVILAVIGTKFFAEWIVWSLIIAGGVVLVQAIFIAWGCDTWSHCFGY